MIMLSTFGGLGSLILPHTLAHSHSFDTGQADDFTIHLPKDALPAPDPASACGGTLSLAAVALRMGASKLGDTTWHVDHVDVSGMSGHV